MWTPERVRDRLIRHVRVNLGKRPAEARPEDWLKAAAFSLREPVAEALLLTEDLTAAAGGKRLAYLSMEFLTGRLLRNNLVALGLVGTTREALQELGVDLEAVEEAEPDPALGNGGLGRLAACFLDSLAALRMPADGFGIHYEYGLFRQEIVDGHQQERADQWHGKRSPWLLPREEEACLVPLYGRIEDSVARDGTANPLWLDWTLVVGVPSLLPVIGYGRSWVNPLRLYAARASDDFDMGIFNSGDYVHAVERKIATETISKVLYPSDNVARGRELRLVQEYFLVACALRHVHRQFTRAYDDFTLFPRKVAIQLNDTHPALAVAELMRLLVDEEAVPWERAWEITVATFGYTNHTLLPEALEKWPVPLFEKVLPRHLALIYEINRRFLDRVGTVWPGDGARAARMSLVEESDPKQIRMAHLAIVGSHAVNGVAKVHSELVKTSLVPDFAALWPERFQNKTNGITPRRWLLQANPELASLLTEAVGDAWITDLERLRPVERLAGDAGFVERMAAIKRRNKEALAKDVRRSTGVVLDPDALLDVHIKRIHEYKRQLLNVLSVVRRYLAIVEDGDESGPPVTYLFAGKAAPGYLLAKTVIRLVHGVAEAVNGDPKASRLMRVVFVPDYRVTVAERIVPAADLSEQISTAGTEASGTGNMKLALNGALTLGTLDGANIEIRDEVGAENIFIFGLTVDEAFALRRGGYDAKARAAADPQLSRVLAALSTTRFCPNERGAYGPIVSRLLEEGDPYLHVADFASYDAARRAAHEASRDTAAWGAKAVLNVARMGAFSSDRAIREYARDIWDLSPVPL
jgi:starch phosphorylase